MYQHMESSNARIDIPIQRLSEQVKYDRRQSRDTTAQWMDGLNNGGERYRMRINIDGFNRNEMNIRVDGNRLFIYGERIENKSQGTSQKLLEKSYHLPPDVDTFRPHVTFPSTTTMQVEFPSKHAPTRSNRYLLPFPFDSTHDKTRDPRRRIPILLSKDPKNIVYQFRRDTPLVQNNSSKQQPILRTYRSPAGHDRSQSPALSSITEEGSVRSHTNSSNESTIFPADFNSEVFYRSIFQPQIFTDDQDQRYIELKLDVHNHNSEDIKVSINGNDLIVQVEKSNFYQQITLPENIDAASLSVHYHHDRKLYISIKLLDEYSSVKYI